MNGQRLTGTLDMISQILVIEAKEIVVFRPSDLLGKTHRSNRIPDSKKPDFGNFGSKWNNSL
jgi:hypothetical protein